MEIHQALKPFALRTKDSFLVGFALDPEKGSPCAQCVELWLADRGVPSQPVEIGILPAPIKSHLSQLLVEKNPHAYIEIFTNGTVSRLNCFVFPHPQCPCNKRAYVAPQEPEKNSVHFAFSPLEQIKCARYGTPSGNLWAFSAAGKSPLSGIPISAYATHSDKERARFRAVEQWLKRSTEADLPFRVRNGESLSSEDFLTSTIQIANRAKIAGLTAHGMGAGVSKNEALLDALLGQARIDTLRHFADSGKKPMLVIGNNSWLRNRAPFFLLQQYDLYLLFYPTLAPTWIVGVAAFSRLSTQEPPKFFFGAHHEIGGALEEALFQTLSHCRPTDWASRASGLKAKTPKAKQASQLNLWWTNWLYRSCPKISMKDILHLEPYENSLERWQQYFRETKRQVSVFSVNSEVMPKEFRHLVKVQIQEAETQEIPQNVQGIGTWDTYRQALPYL